MEQIKNTLTSEELVDDFANKMIERHKDPQKWRGLSFNHPDLDRIIGGARRGEYIVLAGAQKSGKSMLANVEWAKSFANKVHDDEFVIVVSLEMSHEILAARFLSNLTGIDSKKFRNLKLEGDDWDTLAHGADKMRPMAINWTVGTYNIEAIEEAIRSCEGKLRVLIVDYFQLMTDNSSGKRYEQLEKLSANLKRISVQYDCTVVALSQQTREAAQKLSKQRDPNTMAGTQSLARDADALIIILPVEKDGDIIPNLREIWVALNRHGESGQSAEAVIIPEYSRFGALAHEELKDMPYTELQTQWEDL